MHTRFSTDSKMDIEKAIKKAEELNIGIITTEHMDINFPTPESFIFNPEDYFKEYSKYRSDKVLLGIELGMVADRALENKAIAKDYPFDYVIGSTHLVEGVDVFQKAYYAGLDKKTSYEKYFKYMLECLKTHDFIDSLGHIDYIARYSTYEDKEIYYEDFSEYIDEVLRTTALNGKAIEINTRRLSNKDAATNLTKIYSKFYDLGGRIATIGSDSHTEDSIGINFDVARQIAEKSKLKIVYFKERKPEYM